MTELKNKTRYLILDYNNAVKYHNTIDSINIDSTVTMSNDVDSVLGAYTIRYDNGVSQTFTTYDAMYFYIKGIIDGIEKQKILNESED